MPRFNFTIQDASPLIYYTGGLWVEGDPSQDSDAVLYDGSFKVTNSSNTTATLDFVGTGVSIFGALRQNHGDYYVNLDHDQSPPSSISGRGDEFRVDLWHNYGLALGKHTVEVMNEPTPSGSFFDLDYVSIERVIGNDTDPVYLSQIDDTDPTVQYRGSWAPDLTSQTENYNRTIHSTSTPDSEVEITFNGCCIELYGLYTNAGYTVSLDQEPPIAMQGIDVDLPQEVWHPQTLLYLKDGLSEDTHTVTLAATKASQQRPFSFDYAMVRSMQNSTNGFTSATNGSSHKGLSQGAWVGLIIGLFLAGVVVLCLLGLAYILCRQRRPRKMSRESLMAEPEPFEIPQVHIPKPSLRRAPGPRAPVTPSEESTFQFSSVISGWHRLSGIEEQSVTTDGQQSTLWGSSSVRHSSRRGSVQSYRPQRAVTRMKR